MSFKSLERCIVLVDFNNLVWRSFHATEKQNLINDEGINTGCIIGTVNIISQALSNAKNRGLKPRLVICEDSYPTRKKNLYKENQKLFSDRKQDKNWDGINPEKRITYKGNRDKKDYPYNPIEICRQYADCLPHIKIWKEGEEADDVLSSFIHKYSRQKILLYSTDRDLWQLLDKYENLEIFSDSDSSPTEKDARDKFGGGNFSHIILHKIIRGDSGDNVKGVYRFPFKKCTEEYVSSEGNIEKYLSLIYKRYGGESKEFLSLINNIELLILNFELVKLKTDMDFSAKIFKEVNREAWAKLCRSFQTRSLLFSPVLRLFS